MNVMIRPNTVIIEYTRNQLPKGIVSPWEALTVTVITCDAEFPASSVKVILKW